MYCSTKNTRTIIRLSFSATLSWITQSRDTFLCRCVKIAHWNVCSKYSQTLYLIQMHTYICIYTRECANLVWMRVVCAWCLLFTVHIEILFGRIPYIRDECLYFCNSLCTRYTYIVYAYFLFGKRITLRHCLKYCSGLCHWQS